MPGSLKREGRKTSDDVFVWRFQRRRIFFFFFASLREGSAVKILTVDTDDAKRRNMREAAGEDMIDRLLESGEAERRRAR